MISLSVISHSYPADSKFDRKPHQFNRLPSEICSRHIVLLGCLHTPGIIRSLVYYNSEFAVGSEDIYTGIYNKKIEIARTVTRVSRTKRSSDSPMIASCVKLE